MSILNKRLGEIISIKRRPVNSVHDKPRKKQDKNNQDHKQQNVERIKGNRSAQRSNSNKIHLYTIKQRIRTLMKNAMHIQYVMSVIVLQHDRQITAV